MLGIQEFECSVAEGQSDLVFSSWYWG